ncbi:MAG: hypothetical protein IH991_12415 [Planctomycetes bacterium]|nr:hypothetical protein [Planctomycetota bacterium]
MVAHHSIAIILLTGCIAVSVHGVEPKSAADQDLASLRQLGVEPTPEGITKFFRTQMGDGNTSPSQKQAEELIQQLGSDNFQKRQQATKRLAALSNPPIVLLKEAAKSKNLEVALRAKQILKEVGRREDPRLVVCRVIRDKQIRADAAVFLEFVATCEDDMVFDEACSAFAAIVAKTDLRHVQKALIDRRLRVQAAAIRALPAVLPMEDAIAELHKWLKHDELMIRSAAVRAIVAAGKTLDAEIAQNKLDVETVVVVLRAEERQFRMKHKNDRADRDVMKRYQELLTQYAQTLAKSKDVRQVKNPAARNRHHFELGLDTSKHPEILMYRIRWFSGTWSGWFVPGFNDRERGKGRNVRHWGCFNDHQHEVVSTTDKSKYREIADLP